MLEALRTLAAVAAAAGRSDEGKLIDGDDSAAEMRGRLAALG